MNGYKRIKLTKGNETRAPSMCDGTEMGLLNLLVATFSVRYDIFFFGYLNFPCESSTATFENSTVGTCSISKMNSIGLF